VIFPSANQRFFSATINHLFKKKRKKRKKLLLLACYATTAA